MYKSIVSILSNISPYLKGLSQEAVSSLMYLIDIFSKESFLKEKEDHLKVLTSLMESVNYMIAYTDEGNEELFLSLVRNKSLFTSIQSLNLKEEETTTEPTK